MGGTCGCFSFLEDASKAKVEGKSVPPPAATSSSGKTDTEVAGLTKEVASSDLEDVTSWQAGKEGVTDISPSMDGGLLLREPSKLPKDATAPADGAQVTLNLEILELPSKVAIFSCRSFKTQPGSGDLRLPEELELIIPSVKPGGIFLAHCPKFGVFGPLPEMGMWQSLASCLNKEVLIKIEILEVQDLCLATLEGHERLDYAKGRKDAGGRYFKRAKYESALERYSLASEMLQHRDDIKDNTLWTQAQEVKSACELNAAACLLKMEKWRDAEAVCNAILRANPSNEKALFRRGKALLSLGDGDRAEKDLKKILEVNPNNAEAKQLLQQAKKESKGTQRERNVYAKMLQSD